MLTLFRSRTPNRPFAPRRLAVEALEDRATPTVSAITSNFNGTKINAGNTVWFSSVAKVSGLGSAPVTLKVNNATITFTAGTTPYTVIVPNTTITFDPQAAKAAAAFTGGWQVTSPPVSSGNIFLAGQVLPVPGGLPGGIKNVTWTGNFTTDTPGVSVNWQWAAAVYTQFGSDLAGVGVKTVDDGKVDAAYANSDHAGTPEAFKSFVVGGARGGGGSNYTGSYSATGSVTPEVQCPPPVTQSPASISGRVYVDSGGAYSGYDASADTLLAGVSVTLTGTDYLGNLVNVTIFTDANGSYTFAGVNPGTYTLTVTSNPDSDHLANGAALPGTVNVTPTGSSNVKTAIGGITLGSGDAGLEYDFVFVPSGSGG